MTSVTASSGNLHAMDNSPQTGSASPSPISPTFHNQQPTAPRNFMNLNVRGQNNAFPTTPVTASGSSLLQPPPAMSYPDFIRTWTDSHVARWLTDIKCGIHANTFKANDIRGDILLELDQPTLKEMGVASIGDRLRIVNAVKNLRQKCSTRAASSPLAGGNHPRIFPSLDQIDMRPEVVPPTQKQDGSQSESPTSRLASRRLESGRPAPLQLHSSPSRDLPRLIREGQGAPDSANSMRGNPIRPLPLPTQINTPSSSNITPPQVNTPNSNLSSSMPARPTLPPLPPAPRGQPPLPPNRTSSRGHHLITNGRKTPTQADVPPYANSPLPPAPQGGMLTPSTANSQGSSWSNYGLPSDPRPGNPGGKPPIRSASPLPPNRGNSRSPNASTSHARNGSLGANSPNPSSSIQKPTPRPPTASAGSSHPYASAQASLQAPTSQQLHSLSPIAESFVNSSSPNVFSVGRGPFNRPATPSHMTAPSLDDLLRKLVKFTLPDEGHSVKINVADCVGGIEVLEKVLKKFGKGGSRGADTDDVMDHVETENGGLSVDGWGVYLDFGSESGPGSPLTEAELLAICHAPPDEPTRERGLTLRRIGKGKRTKALAQIFGESPPFPGQRTDSPTPPPVVGPKLSTGEEDRDGNLLSPGYGKTFADDDLQAQKNTKRASSISVLSGLGVRDPERTLEPPSSPMASGGGKSPAQSTFKKPSKLRHFFGQRPPSELITTHLAEFFPFTEKKVLERTARNSMLRPARFSTAGKRDSTVSWNPPPASRFSSSTIGSQQGGSLSSRTSISSPPPVPEKTGLPNSLTDDPPRMSLSTDDGHSLELKGDEDQPEPESKTPHILPPVNFPSESLSESMESLTGRRMSRPVSRAMSIASRRLSYMTELRSKRDRSDTASLMTVDEITAEVENRRQSQAVERPTDSSDEWTKVESEDAETRSNSPASTIALESATDDNVGKSDFEDDDEDSLEEDDGPGKTMTDNKGTKWIKGALIGAGSFGKVYLGMDASNGLLMAVKQVELPTGSAPNEERKKSMLSALEREIELLKDLQHDNIVQYLYSSLEEDYLNIFLEYVPGGSVTALLRNYGAFEETLVKNFVRQILEGLNYLHERDIIHRDIKGANILVDNKGGIKISDFGISKKVEDNLLNSKRSNRPSLQGSVFWMAPEVVKQSAHTRKADIWSVGCLVVEMLTGEHPWAQLTQMQAIFKIGSSAKPAIPSDISAEAQDFLQRTFETDHEARPSAGELLQHPWIVFKKPSTKNTAKAPPASTTIEVAA